MVLGLIVCLGDLTAAHRAVTGADKLSKNTSAIKTNVELFGIGANVQVDVKGGGEAVRGSIRSIADENFVVASKDSVGEHSIAYDQVRNLTLTKLTYKASGQPDPAAVRRVAAGCGVGKKVRVTLADGKKVKGVIQSIDKDHFTLLANSQAQSSQIAYGDVQQIGSGGMSTGTSWIILGGIVGAIVIVIAVVVSATSG
jgi:small nuclear ribonucleoprotein (snRNP)-like protein